MPDIFLLTKEELNDCINGIDSTIYFQNCMPSDVPELQQLRNKLVILLNSNIVNILLINKED